MIGGNDKGLRIQRRDRIDGGLNTRSSPIALEESKQSRLLNIDFLEEGSLKLRRFSNTLLQTTWAGAGLMPPPVLTRLAGGGSLAAGDYTIAYWLSHYNGGITDYSSPSATATITGLSANDRIQIDIPPNNLGEAVGSGIEGADDPFSGGPIGPSLSTADNTTFITILAFKTTDPATLTRQTLSTAFAWNTAGRVQRGVLSAYAIGSTLTDSEDPFPLRFIVWHPGLQRLIGITVDKAIAFAQDFSSFTRFAIADDKNGADHFWSRAPVPMFSAFVDQIMVVSDSLSRPKRLHWTGSIATSNWRLIGANAPASVPTAALNAAAGNLTGIYFYKVAFVYRDGRPDLTTLDIESNASGSSTPGVNTAAQRMDVVIPGSLETGLIFRRVYRTRGGGTVFFFHSDQAPGTGTLAFTDNTADSGLGTATPVDDLGKIGNDVPPNRLAYLTQHRSRMFAFQADYIVDSQNRIIDFLATNILRFTKAPASGTSEAVNAWPAEFLLECGDSTPPTGCLPFRGRLLITKSDSMGFVEGRDETDFEYVEAINNAGAMRFSQVVVGSSLYFWEDARGPMMFDGSSTTPIGYEVQNTWIKDDRPFFIYPRACWYDPERYEIHWALSAITNAPPTIVGIAQFFKEYVFSLPTRSWSIWNCESTINNRADGRSVTAAARPVMSTDLGSQARRMVLSTWRGRTQQEGTNISGSGDVDRNTGTIDFKLFFGEQWETVKMPRSIVISSSIPVNATVTVSMCLVNNLILTPVATLTGVATRLTGPASASALQIGQRVDVVDVPSDFFDNPQSVPGKLNEDRALLVSLSLSGVGAASDVIIRGVSWHYKEMSDMRRFP